MYITCLDVEGVLVPCRGKWDPGVEENDQRRAGL